MDTALYILKENETEEKLNIVNFTELQNKEVRDILMFPVLT